MLLRAPVGPQGLPASPCRVKFKKLVSGMLLPAGMREDGRRDRRDLSLNFILKFSFRYSQGHRPTLSSVLLLPGQGSVCTCAWHSGS